MKLLIAASLLSLATASPQPRPVSPAKRHGLVFVSVPQVSSAFAACLRIRGAAAVETHGTSGSFAFSNATHTGVWLLYAQRGRVRAIVVDDIDLTEDERQAVDRCVLWVMRARWERL